jgi:hypothetical protein
MCCPAIEDPAAAGENALRSFLASLPVLTSAGARRRLLRSKRRRAAPEQIPVPRRTSGHADD